MNDDRVFDRTVRAWLEIGPVEAPDRPVLAALHAIASISQDRRLPMPRRFTTMSRTYQYVAAIAAVIVIAGGAILIVPRLSSNGIGSAATPAPTVPPPSPTAPASTAPSVAPSQSPSASAAGVPASGLIAFSLAVGSNDQNSQIQTVKPDGSDLRTLGSVNTCNDAPAIDPTGTRIFFGSSPSSAGQCYTSKTKHVFSMDSSGGSVRQLTTDANGVFSDDPVVSPDGAHVAFDRFDMAGHLTGIWLMKTDGSGLVRITTAPASAKGGDQQPTFSPDGTKLAFVRYGTDSGQEGALYTVAVDGTGLHQIVPASVDAGRPRWSPDGTKIVFSNGYGAAGRHINVVDADGSNLTALTHETTVSWAADPDWSPDGAKIVFSQFRAGNSYVGLVVMDADGSSGADIWYPTPGTDQFPNTPDWVATP
jgi:Tol biopolymer transport system component